MGWVTVQGERYYLGRSALAQLASVEAGPVTAATFWPQVKRGTARWYLQGMRRDGLVQWQEGAGGERFYTLTEVGRAALAVLREQAEPPGMPDPQVEVQRLRAALAAARDALEGMLINPNTAEEQDAIIDGLYRALGESRYGEGSER